MFVTKSEAISILEKMKSEENVNRVMTYINRINAMSNAEWQKFATDNKLTVKAFVEEANRRIMQSPQKFIKLNDLVSYGITGDTLHIHLIPQDAHNLLNRQGFIYAEQELIGALENLRNMLIKDEKLSNIDKVFAVSGILHGPVQSIFDHLGFSTKSMKIEEAKHDKDLSYFYDMFKNSRKLGRAMISKEKLESDEWEQLVIARKKELQNKTRKQNREDRDKAD